MSGCNPTLSISPCGWVTAPSESWCKWKPERPKAPGRKIIILKRTAAKFIEDNEPTKSHKIEIGTLFYLLTMDILHDTNDWIIVL